METLNQFISAMSSAWQQADAVFLVGFGLLFFAVWFFTQLAGAGV